MLDRKASHSRHTSETQISVQLNLDKQDQTDIETDSPFFSHMLEQLSVHGLFGLKVEARGDTEIDDHHLIEDTGIVLGAAFKKALGQRRGIIRYASARLPMDETLIEADIDLSTRSFLHYDLQPGRDFIGKFDTSLPLEFWRAFVGNCGLTLHISQIRGGNAHHIIEASFKAVALSLREACSLDPRKNLQDISSSKGIL